MKGNQTIMNDTKTVNGGQEEKKLNMEELVAKGKKGDLSVEDLDVALEEMDYDLDSIDKLYEALEDSGIPIGDEISLLLKWTRSRARSNVTATVRTWKESLVKRVLPLTTPCVCI